MAFTTNLTIKHIACAAAHVKCFCDASPIIYQTYDDFSLTLAAPNRGGYARA
jgi:hypothetical protein